MKTQSNNFSQFRRIVGNWNHWKAWNGYGHSRAGLERLAGRMRQRWSGRNLGRYGHLQLKSYVAHQLQVQVQVSTNGMALYLLLHADLCNVLSNSSAALSTVCDLMQLQFYFRKNFTVNLKHWFIWYWQILAQKDSLAKTNYSDLYGLWSVNYSFLLPSVLLYWQLSFTSR